MSVFTRFSSLVFDWEPFYNLELAPRYLWIGLYTCKRVLVPGLFHGSVLLMAESVRRPVDETAASLDALLDHELVEYDPKHRVLRMTQLPDAGEWPSNPSIIDAWWKRFTGIPECPVRNAHVPLIRWLIDKGSADAEKSKNGGKPSLKHEEAWGRTFGTATVPAPRRRGVRRLAENNDTSTAVQPGLFGTPEPLRGGSTEPPAGSAYPQIASRAVDKSVENSFSYLTENKETQRLPQSLPRGSGEGEGAGEGDGVSDQGGLGGGSTTPAKPVLALVPPVGSFTVDQLQAEFARCSARWRYVLSDEQRAALGKQIGALELEDGAATLALLGQYAARGGLAGISPDELAAPGELSNAIHKSLAWKRDSDAQAAALREARQQMGY